MFHGTAERRPTLVAVQAVQNLAERGRGQWATAGETCVTAAETQTERESVWEGDSADFSHSAATITELLGDGGPPSQNTTRWLDPLAALEVSQCV